MIGKWWNNLQNRCRTCSRVTLTVGILAIGVLGAVLMMTVGVVAMAHTNTQDFCIGCHEMRDNVYAEFKGTIHDVNRTGVHVICSDCHVPREPIPLVLRKMRATFELIGHFQGVIDTKEKFESHRTKLAHRVWDRMLETDSLECRNCHKRDSMSSELQSEKARNRHAKAQKEGMTCIECHFGIAHKEPEGITPQEMKAAKLEKK